MYYIKAQTEMVEQSLSGPGKLRWYKKENKNVRNLKVHNEKLCAGSMPNPLHNSHPNNGNLVLTQLNNDNQIIKVKLAVQLAKGEWADHQCCVRRFVMIL